ncbi:hypothetical protein BV25DRAFT_1810704 [Artomyces pyxidatus]|uniref:Uncharacterized protein n=1 Tax=Artomyces pyxidatus TaxID=48021 RepID=A0ACB8SPM2_9AGAM|nr:hypothetical protein BV25DRAFT_1810704 [Artomyces pyxidatus]
MVRGPAQKAQEGPTQEAQQKPAQDEPAHDPTYAPYPNAASFRLGQWFWNGGPQKTLAGFRELLQIVGAPDFRSIDVRQTKWDSINSILGKEDPEEWEDTDAGWLRDEVTISVPYFPRRGVRADPDAGPQNLTIDNFYHRDLVSIIREKLSRKDQDAHFHYEPYELHWQPDEESEPVRVYGEMYSSPAFVDAHRILQASPAEPGCKRPRVVAGLMFWSDATQLTSFGDAKLYPLYLYFANDSKHRRCQPTAHLCEHVAYLQTVRHSL